MDYQNTLKYLYESAPMFQQIGGKAYKPGLETTHKLDEHLGHPHQEFRAIHIGGTNGKGSCSHTIAAVLQAAGYKVGLFTSPHLIDFRERIRINGEMIPEEYVVNFVEDHRSFFEPLHPSFFELTTAMAFRYFADQKVDVAVIEVGMGGRLDCTNIITPDLCVITNIGFDHMQYLGHTLNKIAKEKAGIIKEDVPVVVGKVSGAVKRVFTMKAKAMNTFITFSEELKSFTHVQYLSYDNLKESRADLQELLAEEIKLQQIQTLPMKMMQFVSLINPADAIRAIDRIMDKRKDAISIHNSSFMTGLYYELSGLYQTENCLTILAALDILKNLGYEICNKDYHTGFSNVCEMTGLMGRWQKLGEKPTIICDTGHNTGGMQYITEQLRHQTYKTLHIVIGMVNDKDVSGVLSMLPKDARYYFTQASVKRALPYQQMKALAETFNLHGEAYPHVKEAFEAAKEQAQPDDFIFVGGSSFIVADLLSLNN